MIVRTGVWYAGLTRRERLLVAVAGLLAALLVLVYGIVLPIGRALDAAAQRHVAAVERSGRLLAQLAVLQQPAPTGAVAAAGPLDQQVGASAEAAGFVLQSNQARGNDATAVVVPSARPSAVMAWLDGLSREGVVLDTLTVTPAADGSVAVSADLRRAAR